MQISYQTIEIEPPHKVPVLLINKYPVCYFKYCILQCIVQYILAYKAKLYFAYVRWLPILQPDTGLMTKKHWYWRKYKHLIVDLLTWVPLMMTVWAGRLTPQARVAVDTSTWMCLSANSSSTRVLSTLFIPA